MVFTVRAFIPQQEPFDNTFRAEEPGAFGTPKNLPAPKEAPRLTIGTGVKNILDHCDLLLHKKMFNVLIISWF